MGTDELLNRITIDPAAEEPSSHVAGRIGQQRFRSVALMVVATGLLVAVGVVYGFQGDGLQLLAGGDPAPDAQGGSSDGVRLTFQVEADAPADHADVIEVQASPPAALRRGDVGEHDLFITVRGEEPHRADGLKTADRTVSNRDGDGTLRVAGVCAPPPPGQPCFADIWEVLPGETRRVALSLFTSGTSEGTYIVEVPMFLRTRASGERVGTEPASLITLTYTVSSSPVK